MCVCVCVYVCVCMCVCTIIAACSEQYSLDFMSIGCPWEGGLNLESSQRPVMVPSRGK